MISIVKICLIYEDSFGKEFFKNITKDLKDKNLINKKNSLDFKGKLTLNTKLKRIISTIVNDDKKQCDKIVIEYDCDGKCNEITSNINRILGEYKAYVSLLPIKFEIEEWICDSLGIKYNSKRRPAKALKDYEAGKGNTYTKDKLPSYCDRLNYAELNQNKSFQDFLNLMM